MESVVPVPEPEEHRELAKRIVAMADESQRAVLRRWIEQLLELRASDVSVTVKAKRAVSLTANSQFLSTTAKLVADAATPSQLRELTSKLVAINASQLRLPAKIKQAATLTAKELKGAAWDNRGLKSRLAISGAIAGATFFGGQSAGIAALGTAIGVPLWVVFGAGSAFIGVLYEEVTGRKSNPKTTYRVIDAEIEE